MTDSRSVSGYIISSFCVCGDSAGDGYIERNGVALGNVPFTHISGVWLFCAAFSVGAAIVLIASSGVNDILSAIEKYKVSARLSELTTKRKSNLCRVNFRMNARSRLPECRMHSGSYSLFVIIIRLGSVESVPLNLSKMCAVALL